MRQKKNPRSLVPFIRSQVSLFSTLPHAALRDLAAACSEQSYGKGEFVCTAGEPAGGIWLVQEGLVQLNRCARSGANLAIEVLVPGDAFGFASICDRTWPVNAVTIKPSRLFAISRDRMLAIMDKHPAVSRMVISHFVQRLRFLGTRVFLSREPVEKRLIAALAYLSPKFGTEIPLTCADIGALAGTTPETTMRVFARFRKAGLLKTARGKVRVSDLPALMDRMGLE
ncbi:MAG: Crp/Fnr family transcriptional regulator [Elusimicrobiales bacterium]|nr:Crp/Fnr family transcriptional regulator [Elusimicrobiales bacterium]